MKYFLFVPVMALLISPIPGKKNPQNLRKPVIQIQGSSQDEKIKIKKEELPEAAIKTLDGDAFKGWTVANAYKLKSGDFEVELKKDQTTQSLKFDKDGKIK